MNQITDQRLRQTSDSLTLEGKVVVEQPADWGWILVLLSMGVFAISSVTVPALTFVALLLLVAGVVVWVASWAKGGGDEVTLSVESGGRIIVEPEYRKKRVYEQNDISKIKWSPPYGKRTLMMHLYMKDGKHYLAYSQVYSNSFVIDRFRQMGFQSLPDDAESGQERMGKGDENDIDRPSPMSRAKIFETLFSYEWPSHEELVEFALAGHGYGGDDGYYGVRYPDDQDGYGIEVEGEAVIPEACVEVAYWDGETRYLVVPEKEYLRELRDHLKRCGEDSLADRLSHAMA